MSRSGLPSIKRSFHCTYGAHQAPARERTSHRGVVLCRACRDHFESREAIDDVADVANDLDSSGQVAA